MKPDLNPYATAGSEAPSDAPASVSSSRLARGSRVYLGGFCVFSSSVALLSFFVFAHRGFQQIGGDLLMVLPVTVFVGISVLIGLFVGAILHRACTWICIPVQIRTTLIIGTVVLSMIIALRCRGILFSGPWPISLGGIHWILGLPISRYAIACAVVCFSWTAIASLRHRAAAK